MLVAVERERTCELAVCAQCDPQCKRVTETSDCLQEAAGLADVELGQADEELLECRDPALVAQLKTELAKLSVRVLGQRAETAGSAEALAAVDELPQDKQVAALVQLIVEHEIPLATPLYTAQCAGPTIICKVLSQGRPVLKSCFDWFDRIWRKKV